MTVRARLTHTIGAALVAATFLVWLLPASGCAVGWTEPTPDGTRAAMLGVKLGDVAAAGGKIGGFLFEFLGSTEGLITVLGGTTGVGALGLMLRRLVTAWAGAKADAAAERAASIEHDRAWDEATAAERAAARERDATFDEGASRGVLAGVAADRSGVDRAGTKALAHEPAAG